MNRNEYRRAFIMLRPALQGYGGHARLERRTLTASLYFIVSAPHDAGTLTAALAGQRDGTYYAAGIGQLSRDRRGQLTLAYSFDPRNIDGRPLETYAWVAVARADGALALTGNVEGSRPMDVAALRQAVRALVAPEPAPAFDLPEPGEPEPQPPEEEPLPAPEPAREEPADDIRIYTGSKPRVPESEPEPAPEEPAEASAPNDDRTAAQRLALDITRPWPDAAEPLRRLFATQRAEDDAPEDGYTYIRASMPRGSGYGDCLVGLRAEDGVPTAIRYALPGRYSPEPPAGMEDYRWSETGYWVMDMAAEG